MDTGTDSPPEMANCAVTYADESEVRVKNEELRVEGLDRDYGGRGAASELLCIENDSLADGELSERESQRNCASSYRISDANCIRKSPSSLPDDQRSGELSETQKVPQHPKTNCCYKDDHIYFKRKGRIAAEDQEADPSLSVAKKSNLKHYSGPKNTIDRPSGERDQTSAQEGESEGNELPPKKSFPGDDSGKYVRQMIKFSFPAAE